MAHRFRTANQTSPAARARRADYNSREHRHTRAHRVATTRPTDPCGYCGQPLGPERLPSDKRSRWELPHTRDRTGYHPGLWHAHCNRQEAARAGHQAQQARRAPRAQSRPW